MVAISSAVGEIRPASQERLQRAMETVASPAEGPAFEELAARRDALLAYA
jgi:hypothetical protein